MAALWVLNAGYRKCTALHNCAAGLLPQCGPGLLPSVGLACSPVWACGQHNLTALHLWPLQLERAVADPAQRAHIEALGRDLVRQPLSQHFVPVEIRPGVAGYMPTYHTYQRFEDLVRSVLHPTAPTEVGTETVAGSDGSSSGSRSSTSSGSCGSCGGRDSGGSGRDRAGSSSAGAAGTPAESIARGSAAAPAATVKRCVVCGTAAEPGGKLKRCGGCHNVRKGRAWFEYGNVC